MVLRMKNFNILGVHGKIRLLGGGPSWKTNIEVGDCLKRGAWIVCRFKGGLARKRGVVFLKGGEGLIPQCTPRVRDPLSAKVKMNCKLYCYYPMLCYKWNSISQYFAANPSDFWVVLEWSGTLSVWNVFNIFINFLCLLFWG